jgi:glyoxylase-like metal-dependent hydrolase (beta-lactamase superfamily II)
MTEITPGIYWLKLPMNVPETTLTHVNVYLVQGDNGYLLVDTGWNTDEVYNSLQKQIAEIGADIRDISRIVITHIHPDHYGLAGRLKQLYGPELTFHNAEKEFIESRYINMDKLLEQTARWLSINGTPSHEMAEMRDATVSMKQYVVPAYPDVTLYGGETINTGRFNFQVIWTPGHSSGHVCLYEPEKKVLLSGDHILPTITPNIGKHPQSIENPLGRFLDSLNELKKMDIGLVLPGHEKPFTELVPRINELIHHHEVRTQEVLATLNSQPKTAYQIAREITWSIADKWQNIPLFHRRMAVFETLSHLELMANNGRIDKISRDSMIYYRQT